MLREAIWYLVTLPFRMYYVTWCFILILTNKRVPKWLQQRVDQEIKYEPIFGKAESYKR